MGVCLFADVTIDAGKAISDRSAERRAFLEPRTCEAENISSCRLNADEELTGMLRSLNTRSVKTPKYLWYSPLCAVGIQWC
jgi:hypothetical protein